MKLPLVSVIMPVYNSERYVEVAVQSILEQTFRDFELRIVDDGSSDRSLEILRRLAAQDSRIQLTSRPNTGYVIALNEMVQSAKGKYLARMDSDDIALPERFQTQVDFLEKHPKVVVVGGQAELIDADARPIGVLKQPLMHHEIDQLHMKGHAAITHPAAMMRREAVIFSGAYKTQHLPAEDLDLWLRLAERGELANLSTKVLQYRIHDLSVSGSQQQRQRKAAQTVQGEACERRGVDVAFEAAEPWRPSKSRRSQHSFAVKYAWLAFNHEHYDTFRHYARQAIQLRPFSMTSLRLLRAWSKIK